MIFQILPSPSAMPAYTESEALFVMSKTFAYMLTSQKRMLVWTLASVLMNCLHAYIELFFAYTES